MTLKEHKLLVRPLYVPVKLNWPASPELLRNREDPQVEIYTNWKYDHKSLVYVENQLKMGKFSQ